jgi:hypothetical protein
MIPRRLLVLATFIAAASGAALAAPAAPQPAPEPVGAGHGKPIFIATYDSDGDGAVTRVEFDSGRSEGFAQRDADGNGLIDAKEYAAEFEARLTTTSKTERDAQMQQTHERFVVLDDDKDGAMSPAEFADSGAYMFETLDTDSNGTVDSADTAEAY